MRVVPIVAQRDRKTRAITYVTEDQFKAAFQNAAAAGAPSMGDGAPIGSSASADTDADTPTTTTSSDVEPITSEAANDNPPATSTGTD